MKISKDKMIRDAFISNDKLYRYWLSRYWDNNKNILAWIMLNPSTADHKIDDPTIRRCINFADSWDFGGIIVINLFAFRSKDPKDLKKVPDPIGPDNNYFMKKIIKDCKMTVAAWGNGGQYLKRDEEVKKMFPDLLCLKKTISNQPCHPLYLSSSLTPGKFD